VRPEGNPLHDVNGDAGFARVLEVCDRRTGKKKLKYSSGNLGCRFQTKLAWKDRIAHMTREPLDDCVRRRKIRL
jgi:hypothetical protein